MPQSQPQPHDERTELEALERRLLLPRFTADDALDLGLGAIALARREGKAIEISIDQDDHLLFHHAMDGTTLQNSRWIRRKRNTMRLMGCSSLLAMVRLAQEGVGIAERYGVDPEDHSPAGGGFPLRLRDGRLVGTIIVSGLPHREDHDVAVRALAGFLGIDPP